MSKLTEWIRSWQRRACAREDFETALKALEIMSGALGKIARNDEATGGWDTDAEAHEAEAVGAIAEVEKLIGGGG